MAVDAKPLPVFFDGYPFQFPPGCKLFSAGPAFIRPLVDEPGDIPADSYLRLVHLSMDTRSTLRISRHHAYLDLFPLLKMDIVLSEDREIVLRNVLNHYPGLFTSRGECNRDEFLSL